MSETNFKSGTFVSGDYVDTDGHMARYQYLGVVADDRKPWRIHVSRENNLGLSSGELVPVLVFAATSGGLIPSPRLEADTPWWNGGLVLKCIPRDNKFGNVIGINEGDIGRMIWLASEHSPIYRYFNVLAGADQQAMKTVVDRAKAMGMIQLYLSKSEARYPEGYEVLVKVLEEYL